MNTTITVSLPQDIASHLAAVQDLPRMALEALAAEGYREGKLSTGQARRLLGYSTRMQVHSFLKDHGVFLHYDADDLQHDQEAGDGIPAPST